MTNAPTPVIEEGPYTCCRCTASTWNDDDWCDACVTESQKETAPTPAGMAESISPEGLRARANMVRDELNDSGSCARHLELAADEIERLAAQPSAGAEPVANSGLLRPTNARPTRCYCPPDRCDAPVIMGRRAGCFRTATPVQPDSGGVVEAINRIQHNRRAWEDAPGGCVTVHDADLATILAALAPVAAEGGEKDKLRIAVDALERAKGHTQLTHIYAGIDQALSALRTEPTGGGEGA